MVNKIQFVLIRKELKGVVEDGNFWLNYMVLPFVMAVVLPVIFTLMVVVGPGLDDIIVMLPITLAEDGGDFATIQVVINHLIPMFFLLIPMMSATVMATASFTGEKERRTLETLLYSPMSLREIFNAKVIGALLFSMIVTVLSFIAMVIVMGGVVWFTWGRLLIPNAVWLIIVFLVAPALSLVGIIFQVRISAKAKRSEEAYQRSVVLMLPLIMLIVSQLTGIFLMRPWMFLLLGVVLALVAQVLLRVAFSKFTYEELLKG